MFAVIRTGGKQYRVAENDVITVEKLAAEVGTSVDFDQVLMVGDEASATLGTPLVPGAVVSAEVLQQTRGPKIRVFKKKRRKNYRRSAGHRQDLTVLRVLGISADGEKKAAKAAARPKKAEAGARKTAAKPKPEAKPKSAARSTRGKAPSSAKAPAKAKSGAKDRSGAKGTAAGRRGGARRKSAEEKD